MEHDIPKKVLIVGQGTESPLNFVDEEKLVEHLFEPVYFQVATPAEMHSARALLADPSENYTALILTDMNGSGKLPVNEAQARGERDIGRYQRLQLAKEAAAAGKQVVVFSKLDSSLLKEQLRGTLGEKTPLVNLDDNSPEQGDVLKSLDVVVNYLKHPPQRVVRTR